jgi:hypothetical protein
MLAGGENRLRLDGRWLRPWGDDGEGQLGAGPADDTGAVRTVAAWLPLTGSAERSAPHPSDGPGARIGR